MERNVFGFFFHSGKKTHFSLLPPFFQNPNPGLNDVVQNIVFTLADYGVPSDQILGIRHGLRGFYAPGGGAVGGGGKPIELSREAVQGIHLRGGTLLGTSRGGADVSEIVRRLSLWGERERERGGEGGGGKGVFFGKKTKKLTLSLPQSKKNSQ